MKSALDKRTNQYKLTDKDYEILLGELGWRFSKRITDDDEQAISKRSLSDLPTGGGNERSTD